MIGLWMRQSSATIVSNLLLLSTLFLVGCTESDDTAGPVRKLLPARLGDIERIHVYGPIHLSSQPSAADLGVARDVGIETVVNLRAPAEKTEFDEQARVTELEMTYHNPGFSSADELTDEVFTTVRELLRASNDRPLLLHCSSANRVGAVWLAYRVLDEGIVYEDALVEAQLVGLRTPDYRDKARDYIERTQAR